MSHVTFEKSMSNLPYNKAKTETLVFFLMCGYHHINANLGYGYLSRAKIKLILAPDVSLQQNYKP